MPTSFPNWGIARALPGGVGGQPTSGGGYRLATWCRLREAVDGGGHVLHGGPGVNASGFQALVAQDELDDLEVAADPRELNGHVVPERVAGDFWGEVSCLTIALEDVLKGAHREKLTLAVDQQRGAGGRGKTPGGIEAQDSEDGGLGSRVERDDPTLAAFAKRSRQIKQLARLTRPGGHVADVEAAKFRDAQAGVLIEDQGRIVTGTEGRVRRNGRQQGRKFVMSDRSHREESLQV